MVIIFTIGRVWSTSHISCSSQSGKGLEVHLEEGWGQVLSLESFCRIPVLSWEISYANSQPTKFVSSCVWLSVFNFLTSETCLCCPAIFIHWRNDNGILLPKLFWPTVRKKCTSDRKKTFEIWGWRPRICKFFEITCIICSNSQRSEQFLVTEFTGGFSNLRTIIIQTRKK